MAFRGIAGPKEEGEVAYSFVDEKFSLIGAMKRSILTHYMSLS